MNTREDIAYILSQVPLARTRVKRADEHYNNLKYNLFDTALYNAPFNPSENMGGILSHINSPSYNPAWGTREHALKTVGKVSPWLQKKIWNTPGVQESVTNTTNTLLNPEGRGEPVPLEQRQDYSNRFKRDATDMFLGGEPSREAVDKFTKDHYDEAAQFLASPQYKPEGFGGKVFKHMVPRPLKESFLRKGTFNKSIHRQINEARAAKNEQLSRMSPQRPIPDKTLPYNPNQQQGNWWSNMSTPSKYAVGAGGLLLGLGAVRSMFSGPRTTNNYYYGDEDDRDKRRRRADGGRFLD